MEIRLDRGLPIITCRLQYMDRSLELKNVLLDTGCAVTAFDIDAVAPIHLVPSINDKVVRMYGIGGKSENCVELMPSELIINEFHLRGFRIQLGSMKESYGFDGILGIDFMISAGMLLNMQELTIST